MALPSPDSEAGKEQAEFRAYINHQLVEIRRRIGVLEFAFSEDVRRDLAHMIQAVERGLDADWVNKDPKTGIDKLVTVILQQLDLPRQPVYEEVPKDEEKLAQ